MNKKNETSDFENQLIQKGLNDVLNGNISSHENVKKRFEEKFKITKHKTAIKR